MLSSVPDQSEELTQSLLDNSAMRGENAALRQALQVNVAAVNSLFGRVLELESEHPWLADGLRRSEQRCAELETQLVELGDELETRRECEQRCEELESLLADALGQLDALYQTKTLPRRRARRAGCGAWCSRPPVRAGEQLDELRERPPRAVSAAGARQSRRRHRRSTGSARVLRCHRRGDSREYLLDVLPDDWSFAGKHVLDFGCGAGRTLRHFIHDAETAEFWGCDIDEPSIEWLREHLCPPFHAVPNGPMPPLAFEDGFFDLAYVISVFTHLTGSWSAWLLEMHRVLADNGILIATFMGEGLCEITSGEPWVEERVGMNVHSPDQGWDLGGPDGPALALVDPRPLGPRVEILAVQPYGFLVQGVSGQGIVVMRKRPGTFSVDDLEALEPFEDRERVALHHMIDGLQRENSKLRAYTHALEANRG